LKHTLPPHPTPQVMPAAPDEHKEELIGRYDSPGNSTCDPELLVLDRTSHGPIDVAREVQRHRRGCGSSCLRHGGGEANHATSGHQAPSRLSQVNFSVEGGWQVRFGCWCCSAARGERPTTLPGYRERYPVLSVASQARAEARHRRVCGSSLWLDVLSFSHRGY